MSRAEQARQYFSQGYNCAQAVVLAFSDFYRHWTAKESYIKFYGETLAALWRKVEFYQGKIYLRGEETDAHILQFEMDNYVFSVCGDYAKLNIRRIEP